LFNADDVHLLGENINTVNNFLGLLVMRFL